MSMSDFELLRERDARSGVRLRTLVLIRWFAIAGQFTAIITALWFFGVQFEYGFAIMTVGASVVANLVFTVIYPGSKRLAEREATRMLIFDTCQLALLLYITGGLTNPFAVLLLAPVTISATVLRLNSSLLLALLTILAVSALALAGLPLTDAVGRALTLPDI